MLAVGRNAVYDTGSQNAALVQRTGLAIVQLLGIGFGIGAPARGVKGDANVVVVAISVAAREALRIVVSILAVDDLGHESKIWGFVNFIHRVVGALRMIGLQHQPTLSNRWTR